VGPREPETADYANRAMAEDPVVLMESRGSASFDSSATIAGRASATGSRWITPNGWDS
jgi:hypothetical protein